MSRNLRLRQLTGLRFMDQLAERVRRQHHDAIGELQRYVIDPPLFSAEDSGAVPASGTRGTDNFLREDGTWAEPQGAGTAEPANGDKGDITIAAGVWTIDAAVVTLAKLANVATARILGRVTAGTGVPEAMTGTQTTTLLDVFTSALKGLVPLSGGGTTNFLRADATWAVPVWTNAAFFGDGSDGDVTIAAGTTTLTRTMYYNNLTIASGATLKSGGFSIHVKGTLTFADSTATISRAGNPGTDASGTTPGVGGVALSGGFTPTSSAGAAGSAAVANASNSVTGVYRGDVAVGGAGGNGSFHNGAAAGVLTAEVAATAGDVRLAVHAVNARTHAGTAITSTATGGAGGGGTQFAQAASGGAGGGGGWLIVTAKSIVHTSGTGVLTAQGGSAGAGSAPNAGHGAGGSGGGGGGVVVLVYHDGTLPTVTVTGGAGALAVTNGAPAPNACTNGFNGGDGIQLVYQV